MTRPGLCASRSSTVHRTDAPVETSVTFTTVPNAKVGLAQVPAGEPYHDARPLVSCAGAAGGTGATGFGTGTATGGLGVATTATGTTTGGFGLGAVGGGEGVEDVVVGVGNTCRYETFTTRVMGPDNVTGNDALVTALDGGAGRARRVKATGVVHDVDRRVSGSSARPGRAPAWCPRPCNVARCGVASRRSGTTTTARQHASCAPCRNPPALRVLRSPPFLCGLHVNCVGIANHVRRGRGHHQFDAKKAHLEAQRDRILKFRTVTREATERGKRTTCNGR